MQTNMPGYYVTRSGLAAAIGDAEILGSLKSVLLSQAAPRTIGALKKRGLIAKEKRDNPVRVDHTALVLEGAIDRIREVVSKPAAAAKRGRPAKAAAPEAPAVQERPRLLAPKIGYVATRPGTTPRDLTPSTAAVYKALGKRPLRIGDLSAKVKDVHPNTVRWAVQILRQRRLVKSVVLD